MVSHVSAELSPSCIHHQKKQILILAVQPAKIKGYFYFSVRPILPWFNKIYILVCARRFNSDFFLEGDGGGWMFGILFSVLMFVFPLAVLKYW